MQAELLSGGWRVGKSPFLMDLGTPGTSPKTTELMCLKDLTVLL